MYIEFFENFKPARWVPIIMFATDPTNSVNWLSTLGFPLHTSSPTVEVENWPKLLSGYNFDHFFANCFLKHQFFSWFII